MKPPRLWQDWVILAAALWLYVSPFVLGDASLREPATATAWACATVLIASCSEAVAWPDVVEEWANLTVALVLLAGPWVFHYGAQSAQAFNSLAVGALVAVCAFSALRRDLGMKRTKATP